DIGWSRSPVAPLSSLSGGGACGRLASAGNSGVTVAPADLAAGVVAGPACDSPLLRRLNARRTLRPPDDALGTSVPSRSTAVVCPPAVGLLNGTSPMINLRISPYRSGVVRSLITTLPSRSTLQKPPMIV